MPNYNGAKYIKESINSVLEQSYPEFELIIVDDGSTDNSLDIVKQFQNDRISVVCRSDNWPKGANSCRNIGIENAKGEYLLFLDSDDLLMQDCLKNRVLFMNSNKRIEFSVFNSVKFFKSKDDATVFTRLSINNPISHFICTDNLWQTSSVIWRSEFVRSIGGFNLNYQRIQDPEMTLRAFFASQGRYALVKDSAPDFMYRRPRMLADNKKSKAYRTYFRFVEDFYVPSNRKYINLGNSKFLFYTISILHIQYCESADDFQNYIETMNRLALFNPTIKSNNIFKLCCHYHASQFLKRKFLRKILLKYIGFCRTKIVI